MNWLLIVFVVFVVLEIILSYRRGFAKMLLSLCSTVAAIIAVIILAPIVKNLVVNNTKFETQLAEKIEHAIESKLSDGESIPDVVDGLPLPEGIKEALGLNAEGMGGGAKEKIAAASLKIADVAVTAGVYVGTFLVVLLALRLLSGLMNLVTKIPGLQQLNGILGIALGLVECLIVVDAVFLIIMSISNTELGATLTGMIKDSKVLTFVYEHNVLSAIWANMFKAKA